MPTEPMRNFDMYLVYIVFCHSLITVSAVMLTLKRTVVVKRELSQKAKLSIYRSIYIPTLTYGHELWVVTERIKS